MADPNQIPRHRKRTVDPAHPVYELDLWLAGSDPLIWRSLLVPARFTLGRLHGVIQCVMPWEEDHMHAFEIKQRNRYGMVEEIDEDATTLRDVFEHLKKTLGYEYDFGDSWAHGIKLIDTHPDAAAFEQLPVCLDGKNAAPPEDSGGLWGYYDKLRALADSDEEIREWMGEDFDPAAFDLRQVNADLKRFFPQPRSKAAKRAGPTLRQRQERKNKRKR